MMSLKRSLLVTAALLAALCIAFAAVWLHDNRVLRDFGAEVLDIQANKPITGQVIERANARLARYIELGHAGHFLFPGIRATAVQVLERGGDCADRSRLLTTVLSEYGIRATMVMLAPCTGCSFGHTVVEAIVADGRIVVDPTYGIAFPKPGGGYYDIRDLRRDPSIVRHEVAALQVQDKDKQAYVDFRSRYLGYFNDSRTINFGTNAFGQWATRIVLAFDAEPELIYRPRILEDPILVLVLLLGAGTLFTSTALGVLVLRDRRHGSRPSHTPQHPADPSTGVQYSPNAPVVQDDSASQGHRVR